MTPTPEEVGLYIFILAGFLGYHVISRVPPLLHTPLMSATNAISGISLIGSLVVAGRQVGHLDTFLGFLAVTCSATNVVGGFLITDRMLKMFKKSQDRTTGRGAIGLSWPVLLIGLLILAGALVILPRVDPDEVLRYLYILSAVLFILGLKGLSSPRWARQGMFLAEFGMLVAVVGTLFDKHIQTY